MDERGRMGVLAVLVLISISAVFVLAAKPPRFSCSDTDGGWNAYIKGTVSGYNYGIWYNDTDYCNGEIALVEYYCAGNRKYNEYHNCDLNESRVCSNGACVTTTTTTSTTTTTLPPTTTTTTSSTTTTIGNSCSDSDGGQNVTIRGNVTGYFSGNPYSMADYCGTSRDLTEYYCSGTNPTSYSYDCTVGNTTASSCINGACT